LGYLCFGSTFLLVFSLIKSTLFDGFGKELVHGTRLVFTFLGLGLFLYKYPPFALDESYLYILVCITFSISSPFVLKSHGVRRAHPPRGEARLPQDFLFERE